jgi:hypothetical protein
MKTSIVARKAFVPKRHIVVMSSSRKRLCKGIGDKSINLMQLTDREFVKEIEGTRRRFNEKYPHLSNLIFEYRKQTVLLDLDIWYERPLPKRCERFLKIDIMSLMDNIEEDTEEGKNIQDLCNALFTKYGLLIEDNEGENERNGNCI